MAASVSPDLREPAPAEIVRRLAEGLHPERIYLFGSMARGEEGEDSDYDVMVVVSDPAEPLRDLERRAYGLLWDVPVPVDVLVWARDDFDRRLTVVASLPATILREGRLLYAA